MTSLTQRQLLLRKELAQLKVLYQTPHTPETLALLAELFDEAMPVETDCPTLTRAFALYRKTGKCFPTPAHINELLPDCCQTPVHDALPQGKIKRTPGYGRSLYEKWKLRHTGTEVHKILDKLAKQADEASESQK